MIGKWLKTLENAPSGPDKVNETWYVVPQDFIRALKRYKPGDTVPSIVNLPLLASNYSDEEIRPTPPPTDRMSDSSRLDRMGESDSCPDTNVVGVTEPAVYTRLREDVRQGEDFEVYPESVWNLLESDGLRYDCKIPRGCFADDNGRPRVDVQPILVRFVVALPSTEETISDEALFVDVILKLRDIGSSLWSQICEACPKLIDDECEMDGSSAYALKMHLDNLRVIETGISKCERWVHIFSRVFEELFRDLSKCGILKAERPADGSLAVHWRSATCDDDDTTFWDCSLTDSLAVSDVVDGEGLDLLLWTCDSAVRNLNAKPSVVLPPMPSKSVSTKDVNRMLWKGGLVGLQNLGNTCFMNSALQCLSHTLPLTRYYLSGLYTKDLNTTNPLGMEGNLAKVYANFLQQYWEDCERARSKSVAPRHLKGCIGRFAPNFQGYAQQDSQELLCFLLDGLHEDCNRIVDKPYIEAVDGGEEQSDVLLASESWNRHKKRNDSKVVDLFQGQFRSRLECPTCGSVSKTFDPFLSCSLPIPEKRRCAVTVTFLIDDGSPVSWPFRFFIAVNYREETLSRYNAEQEELARQFIGPMLPTRPRGPTTNSESLKAILEIEASQISFKIGQVLLEAFHQYKTEATSQGHPVRITPELKRLGRFLEQSPIFLGLYAEALKKVIPPDEKSPKRPDPLCRALSADVELKDGGGFGTLNIQTTRQIIEDQEAQRVASLSADEEQLEIRHAHSPTCVKRLVAASSPLEFVGASATHVVSAVIEDVGFAPNQEFIGEDDFAHILNVVSLKPLPDSDYAAPIVVSASLELPDVLFREIAPSTADQLFNVLTLTFLVPGAEFRKQSMLEGIKELVQRFIEGIRDIIGSQNAQLDTAKLVQMMGGSLIPVSPHDGTVLRHKILTFDLINGTFSGVEESTMGEWITSCNLDAPLGSAPRTNRVHLNLKTSVDFYEVIAEQWSASVLTRRSPEGTMELLDSMIWNATSLAQAAATIFPSVVDTLRPRMSKNLIISFNAPFGTLSKRARWPASPADTSCAISALPQPKVSLGECFSEFGACERLEGDNKWFCSKCKDFQSAAKKMDFWRLPEILVIHLKRFAQQGRIRRAKMTAGVHFPHKYDEPLDMRPYLLPESPDKTDDRKHLYRLFGVSNHFGSLFAGHYTAAVRCFAQGPPPNKEMLNFWANFDDTSVRHLGRDGEVNLDEMDTSAYILFYERMGPRFWKE